ncbi:MAG: serine/threonine protein kinase [Opitutales bacterium]|nr:serine/threonine protein kinase [Opitutales bacterium]
MKTFIGETTGIHYEAKKMLGEGGQGFIVGAHAPDGRRVAVKWFKRKWATPRHRSQIAQLARDGKPNSDTPAIQFIWPEEIVTCKENAESFGYVMPFIDGRFKGYYDLTEQKVRLRMDRLCRVAYHFASALRQVHHRGRSYGDINFGNLHFDPETGDVAVCDNDNVVVNNDKSGIAGITEFMAPEVALRKVGPNRDSDLYSLAVTFYHFFMWHHPLDGKKAQALRCWDNLAKKKLFAEEPVFVFDPRDTSNDTDGLPELALHEARWRWMCPPEIRVEFLRTFTEGLSEPHKRTTVSKWQRVFLEAEANALVSPAGAHTIWSAQGDNWGCFKTRQRLPEARAVLRFHGPAAHRPLLVATTGAPLRRHHLDPQALDPKDNPTEILGRVEAHPRSPGHFILRNHSTETWSVHSSAGERLDVAPGSARALVPGARWGIGGVSVEVMAQGDLG